MRPIRSACQNLHTCYTGRFSSWLAFARLIGAYRRAHGPRGGCRNLEEHMRRAVQPRRPARRSLALDDHGAEAIEWAGMLAVIAVLFLGIAVVMSRNGTSLAQPLAQVLQCNIASVLGGGGCASQSGAHLPSLPALSIPGLLVLGAAVIGMLG